MQPLSLEPIRQAVASGEFDRAQLLWNECVAALAEALRNRTLSNARLREVRALAEWSRIVVLCERVRLQDLLNGLHVAIEYELPVPPPARRTVQASF